MPSEPARPAILVAATHSGAGKTTVTGLVLRAVRRRGLSVQAFKIGPDFIDSTYLAEATGRPAINLDLWMTGEHGVRGSYRRRSGDVDVSVIESMGALYDGADPSGHGSAAHIAKLLGVPVVVVLDVWGMTRTAGAILEGLLAFDRDVDIAACILNRVGSREHAAMIMDVLPASLRGLVVGSIERRSELEIPERHLGLLTVEENGASAAARDAAGAQAAELLDVDRLLAIAGARAPVEARKVPQAHRPTSRRPAARLAIARDDAFCFYYEENLELLREAGFELVPFAPTRDRKLPADTDAVYIGGGYPESFATELETNGALAGELRERATQGLPIYAECGGLVYLARSLTGFDGARRAMSGVLPLDVAMDSDRLAIRYVEVRTRVASPLGGAGTEARGQEFHQSHVVAADVAATLYDVTTSTGERYSDGYAWRSVVASYAHLHFGSNPELVHNLLRAAVC
ncbi:MAG TPA: cobyrinate a,c-diamide synthase [Thermoleophilaceae bacterium]|nr:cobyrinate a,c-diamide synthase [Thermoleophilaceae bacterium]